MEICTERVNGTTIVSVGVARLDVNSMDEFRQRMETIMCTGCGIVLDMGNVDVIDSSGLGVILYCMHYLKARNRRLGVCGMTRPVQLMFDLARLEKIVQVYSSRDQAVEALACP